MIHGSVVAGFDDGVGVFPWQKRGVVDCQVVHLTEVFNEAKALEEAKEGQKAAEKVTKQSDAIVGKVTKLEVYATEQLSAFNTLNVKSVSVGSPTRFT